MEKGELYGQVGVNGKEKGSLNSPRGVRRDVIVYSTPKPAVSSTLGKKRTKQSELQSSDQRRQGKDQKTHAHESFVSRSSNVA